MSLNPLSRRAVVSGAVVSAAMATPALASATPDPDADLLELARRYFEHEEHSAKAWAAFDAMTDAYNAARDDVPPALRKTEADITLRLAIRSQIDAEPVYREKDVEIFRAQRRTRMVERLVTPADNLPAGARTKVAAEPWLEAQARASEIVAAWDAWKAELARYHEALGLPAQGDVVDKLATQERWMFRRIARTPALTVAGIIAKARVVSTRTGLLDENPAALDFTDRSIASVLSDLVRLNS